MDVSTIDNRELRRQYVTPTLPAPLVEANLVSFAQEDLKQRAVNWAILDWIDLEARLPVLVRGILTVEDALLACEHYASGIIVSNHGSRQLDRAVMSIEALPEIVDAVAGCCEVSLEDSRKAVPDHAQPLSLDGWQRGQEVYPAGEIVEVLCLQAGASKQVSGQCEALIRSPMQSFPGLANLRRIRVLLLRLHK